MNARHPDAPTAEQTAERILQRIARATSKAPARADEVRSDLGLNQATFAAGLDHLQRHRQIATAEIQRAGDDAMWLAIWPTGVCVEAGSWTGSSHSGLFDKDATPRRFPKAPDPTRDPRPDLRTRKPAAPAKEEPMQEAQSLPRPRGKQQTARQPISEADIQAFADGLEPEPETVLTPDAAEQPAQPATPQIDFALWADGRLDIVDGDELIQIPPPDVARLALLLGVPGAALPQLIGA